MIRKIFPHAKGLFAIRTTRYLYPRAFSSYTNKSITDDVISNTPTSATTIDDNDDTMEFLVNEESPEVSLHRFIEEKRAESAWNSYLELSSANPTDPIAFSTLHQLMVTLAEYGPKNNETKRRVSVIGKRIRSTSIENGANTELTERQYGLLLHALASGRVFEDCLDVLEDMRSLKLNAGQHNFEYIVKEMVGNREVEMGLQLSSEYRARGFESTSTLFSALIRGFRLISDMKSAESTLSAKQKAGFAPTLDDYCDIIRGYISRKQYDEAEKWNTLLLSENMPLTPKLTSIFLYGYSKYNLEATLSWFDKHKEIDPDRTSTTAWNSMLYALTANNHLSECLKLFHEMQTLGPSPDPATYHIMLNYFSKHGDLPTAHRLFQKMKETKSLKIDSFPYTILIDAHVKRTEIDKAHELMDEMKQSDIAPNIVTYTTLLDGYSKSGNFEAAIEVYEYCKKGGYLLDNVICNSLLYGAAVNGKYDIVYRVYKDMQEKDIEFSEYTYTALIFSFAKRGDLDNAKRMMGEIEEVGLKMDTYHYNALLAGYVVDNNAKEAYKILHEMRKKDLRPNVGTYNILMQLANAEGRVDNVLKFFNIMVRDGGIEVIDSHTISNVMRILGEQNSVDALKSTFSALVAAGDSGKLKLDDLSWTSYVYALARNKEFDCAMDEIKNMLGYGVVPRQDRIARVLDLFKDQGLWDQVDEVVNLLEDSFSSSSSQKRIDLEEKDNYLEQMFTKK